MAIFRSLRLLMGNMVVAVFDILPLGKLETLVHGLVTRRVAAMKPDEALRFMFRLEAALYPLLGRYAVLYGGGLHTKHRHTKYHDFFVERCRPEDNVLEVGCGIGSLAHDIAERSGCRVDGVDINPQSIEDGKARFSHPNLAFSVCDATVDLPVGRYDVVVLSNVLEHLTDRVRFLRRLMEKTGGTRCLIRVPLFERDWRVPLKRELGVEWRLDPTHETEYSLESFAAEMAEAGLEIIHREVRWGEIWAEARWLIPVQA